VLEQWARFWHLWVSVTFFKAYLDVAAGMPFVPETPEELEVLRDTYPLEKALYELGYELNNRPRWTKIPLQGTLQLVAPAR